MSGRPQVIQTLDEMRQVRAKWEAEGRRVVLVPTMGYLHEGHLTLLREGRKRGDLVLMSLFVNPTQFEPHEDLDRYPMDFEGDLAKAAACGTQAVFAPPREAMYPAGERTRVRVEGLSQVMCGRDRPNHFTGVATIVLKLLALIRPQVAIFGRKDYQQLQVIRRMAADMLLDVEIVGLPTVREPDGLAMSSRNAYLGAEDRQRGLALSRGLGLARQAFEAGEREAQALRAIIADTLAQQGLDPQYIEVVDADSLQPVTQVERNAVIGLAAWVGKARLIDNVELQMAEQGP